VGILNKCECTGFLRSSNVNANICPNNCNLVGSTVTLFDGRTGQVTDVDCCGNTLTATGTIPNQDLTTNDFTLIMIETGTPFNVYFFVEVMPSAGPVNVLWEVRPVSDLQFTPCS
jgi:hypothetical protein